MKKMFLVSILICCACFSFSEDKSISRIDGMSFHAIEISFKRYVEHENICGADICNYQFEVTNNAGIYSVTIYNKKVALGSGAVFIINMNTHKVENEKYYE